MKAFVNTETCTGCGLCVDTCPEVFEMDEDDLAGVKVEIVAPEDEDNCRQAAEDCPVDAISIEE